MFQSCFLRILLTSWIMILIKDNLFLTSFLFRCSPFRILASATQPNLQFSLFLFLLVMWNNYCCFLAFYLPPDNIENRVLMWFVIMIFLLEHYYLAYASSECYTIKGRSLFLPPAAKWLRKNKFGVRRKNESRS